MTFAEFHNALRILASIDRDELEQAGVIGYADHDAWGTFRRCPWGWFIRCDDDKAAKLWNLMQKRIPA